MALVRSAPSSREWVNGVPRLPWGRVSLLTLAIFACSISGLEAYWRALGLKPDVPDSVELWACQRSGVVGHDPKLIVAIGTSRIRSGISPAAVAEFLPDYRLVQLGVTGPVSPLGVLAEISRIPGFSGIVLCDVLPPLLDQVHWRDQADFYDRPAANNPAWALVPYWEIREHLVVANSELSIRKWLEGGRPSDAHYLRNHIDRSLTMDIASDELTAHIRETRLKEYSALYRTRPHYKSLEDFASTLQPLVEVVTRIHRYHGRVVILRLPSSGSRLQLEEAAFPSAEYFSVAARATNVPWIDFRDLPEKEAFLCPDDSHLSPTGAYAFTESLIKELQRRELLSN
jgi:hypothetical protein